MLGVLLTSGLLYFRGLQRSTGTRRRLHPWWRPTLFYTALTVLFIALVSPLDHLSGELFTFHMVQHLLLTLVAAPLLLLSAPMIPVLRGFPRPLLRRVVAPLLRHRAVRRPLKLLSMPLIAWSVYVVAVLGWHTPTAYELALRNQVVHDLEHISFSVAALFFWWNVIDAVPLRSNLSYMGRLPYVFLTTVPNFSLGAFLVFSDRSWYAHYASQTLALGFTAQEDQQFGSALMWVGSSLVLLAALLTVLVYTLVTEERRQQEKEARASARMRSTGTQPPPP